MATGNRVAQRINVKGKSKTDGKFTLFYGGAVLTVPFTAKTTAAQLTRKVNEAVAQSGLPWVPFSR